MKRLCIRAWIALAVVLTLASCDDLIYDDEGDCAVTYRLKFRYDWNMKFADAFAHEVTSVAVYAFDENGTLVWQTTDKGSDLAADDYSVKLDLPAGNYDLIAWCGLDNESTAESFALPQTTVGTTTKQELTCRLNRQHDSDGNAYTESDLYSLYHGQLSVSLPTNEDGGDYVYTMSLMKDTNHLRVILQHLSGEDVDVSKFSFSLDCENGLMDYDNSLLSDENITYNAWNTESGEASIDAESKTRAQTSVGVAIADITTGRLVKDNKIYLTIRNSEGETVVHIPFIDYALLVKGYYNREMSDQEYLDRQDEWSMTFFLDENNEWVSSTVIINSWRLVLQDVDMK